MTERRGRKGTRSLYPVGTTKLVLKLLENRQRRRIREQSWQTWWADGGELPTAARELLQESARNFDRVSRILGRLLDREESGSEADAERMNKLYEHSQNSRLSGPLATARRRTGKSSFSTVARVLAQIGSGRFNAYPDDETDADGTPRPGTTAALVERALGLDRARTDRLAEAPPWYSGTSETDLARLSRLIVRRSLADLAAAPESALDQARLDLKAFVTVVAQTASMMERFCGRNAFGFGLFARALTWDRAGNQTVLLLGWLALGQEPDLKKGMDEFVALAPLVNTWMELQRVLDELRAEIPAFADVFSDRRIGQALKSSVAAARLSEDIARTRTENQQAVEAFLKLHPDIGGLLSLSED